MTFLRFFTYPQQSLAWYLKCLIFGSHLRLFLLPYLRDGLSLGDYYCSELPLPWFSQSYHQNDDGKAVLGPDSLFFNSTQRGHWGGPAFNIDQPLPQWCSFESVLMLLVAREEEKETFYSCISQEWFFKWLFLPFYLTLLIKALLVLTIKSKFLSMGFKDLPDLFSALTFSTLANQFSKWNFS